MIENTTLSQYHENATRQQCYKNTMPQYNNTNIQQNDNTTIKNITILQYNIPTI